MISKLFTLLILLGLAFNGISQEIQSLFKAKSFTEAYFNPVYQELKKRKDNNIALSKNEKKWLEAYQQYLDNYFSLLNNNQQNIFHEQRSGIAYSKTDSTGTEPAPLTNITDKNNDLIPERDNELLLGHIAFSGVSGVVYGIQFNYLFNNDGSNRIGVPLFISGTSMLATIFMPQYNNINTNSLWLRLHGKTMGGIYGYFLAGTAFGDDIFETWDDNSWEQGPNRNKKPLAVASSLIGSIALGHLGMKYGKTKPWTDGRIATYQYYSYAMPTFACGILFSFSENAEFQAYSSLITAGVPLGYIAGHQIANRFEYTRGDINAITNNSAIGAAFGASLLFYTEPESRAALLVPLGTALAGSAFGHYTFKNFHISRTEARRLNYATIGGGLIGLGIAIMAEPDSEGTYLLLPTLFGSAGYASLLSYYKKQPRFSGKKPKKNNFSFSLHPESLIINKQLPSHMQAPLFSARIKL